jgi:hypothetical protein
VAIGSDQEGVAGRWGSADGSGAEGAAGVEGDTTAAPLGRAAPHFQQTSPAFFEAQLSQVHSSMRDLPGWPRPPGRLVASRAAQGYSSLRRNW